MSAASFSSAMGPVRDTYGFDRADKFLMPQGQSRDFGPAGPVSSAPAAGQSQNQGYPAAPANPYRAQTAETNARNRAGTYAGSSFEDWYSGLSPDEKDKFLPRTFGTSSMTMTTADGKTVGGSGTADDAVATEAAARAHYMQHILPKDPKYQQLQSDSNDATDARTAGVSVQDYQRGRAGVTGAANSANAIASDAAARSTLAGGEASEATGRGDLARAQGSTLVPAQARNLDAGANATNTDARIKGAQWDAAAPLYPQQISAQIGQTNAAAGYDNARADAARAQGTAAAVTAYGAANRPTITKNDSGDPVAVPGEYSYGAPPSGSLLPTITQRSASAPASPPPAPSSAPGDGQPPSAPLTPAAPAAPSLTDRANAAMTAVNGSMASPWSVLGPAAMAPRAIAAGIGAFRNPSTPQPAQAPAGKSITVNGVVLTQQNDGSYAGNNGRKYKIGADGKFNLVG